MICEPYGFLMKLLPYDTDSLWKIALWNLPYVSLWNRSPYGTHTLCYPYE